MSRKRSARGARGVPRRASSRAPSATGVDRETARHGLRQARRLLRLRLPEVARGRVRAARLPVGLAAPPLPGRVPLRAAERAADGLLPAGEPRPRRAAARGGGAARRDVNRSARAAARVEDGSGARSGSATSSSVGEDEAEALVAERERGRAVRGRRATSPSARRSARDALEALVASGACDWLRRRRRRELLWELGLVAAAAERPGRGGEEQQLALPLEPTAETPELPRADAWERMLADYRHDEPLGRRPPARAPAPAPADGHARRAASSHERAARRSGSPSPGMAVARQRPATANGVVFMLLEDELGQMNLIVPPQVYERSPRDRPRRAAPARARAASSASAATRTSSSTSSSRSARSPARSPGDAKWARSLPERPPFRSSLVSRAPHAARAAALETLLAE